MGWFALLAGRLCYGQARVASTKNNNNKQKAFVATWAGILLCYNVCLTYEKSLGKNKTHSSQNSVMMCFSFPSLIFSGKWDRTCLPPFYVKKTRFVPLCRRPLPATKSQNKWRGVAAWRRQAGRHGWWLAGGEEAGRKIKWQHETGQQGSRSAGWQGRSAERLAGALSMLRRGRKNQLLMEKSLTKSSGPMCMSHACL